MWDTISDSMKRWAAVGVLFVVTAGLRYVTYWSPRPQDPTRQNILAPIPISESPAVASRDPKAATWHVAYVTQNVSESAETGLEFGVAEINLPLMSRVRGALPLASEEEGEQPGKVAIQRRQAVPREQLYTYLHQQIDKAPQKDLLIFVHGFNVSFDEAVCRVAQMAEDMPFSGVILAFDWKSFGHEVGYVNDLITTGTTHSSLATVLAELRAELDDSHKIHILAHSMGNRYTLNALQLLATYQPLVGLPRETISKLTAIQPLFPEWERWHPRYGEPVPIDNLIFAAADVDPGTFSKQLSDIHRVAEHMTLYCNEADFALDLSRIVNGQGKNGFRIGDARSGGASGVDVIRLQQVSVNDPFGHSYYGSHVGMLTDLSLLLKGDKTPVARPTITAGAWPNEDHLYLR